MLTALAILLSGITAWLTCETVQRFRTYSTGDDWWRAFVLGMIALAFGIADALAIFLWLITHWN